MNNENKLYPKIIQRGLVPELTHDCHHHNHHCHDKCKCDECNYSRVDICELNGVLEYLHKSILNVKEYETLGYIPNKLYGKGSIVIFENKLYVAKTDTSTLPTSEFWSEFDLNTKPQSYYNELPIGTVVTVPSNTDVFGFIDYEVGKTFSKTLYPALFNTLGNNVFPQSPTITGQTDLPVGSIIHVFDYNDIPKGWVPLDHVPNSLAGTELLEKLTKLTTQLPPSVVRTAWEKAIKLQTFPAFSTDFFLRVIRKNSVKNVGELFADTTVSQYNNHFIIPKVVNTPFGNSKPLKANIFRSLEDNGSIIEDTPTDTRDIVVFGASAAEYKLMTGKDVQSSLLTISQDITKQGDDNEVAPYHMCTYAIVKADNVENTLGSFKQIIKAYDVVDTPREAIVLEISELLNTRLDFINKYKELELALQDKVKEFDKLFKDKIDEFYEEARKNLDTFSNASTEALESIKQEYKDIINKAHVEFNAKLLLLNNTIESKVREALTKNNEELVKLQEKVNLQEDKLNLQEQEISRLKVLIESLKSQVGKLPANVLTIDDFGLDHKNYAEATKEDGTLTTKVLGTNEYLLGQPDKFYVTGDYVLPLYRKAK